MERSGYEKRSKRIKAVLDFFMASFYSNAHEVVDKIESLYHENASFTKESLKEENDIPSHISALEIKIRDMPSSGKLSLTLRQEGLSRAGLIGELNQDVEAIKKKHHDFKEQYIQSLEKRFETLRKEIETSDDETAIERKKGILRDIVASYTLFKAEVIDKDASFSISTNETIERYNNLLKEQEKFEEGLKQVIVEYISIDSPAGYDSICRKVEILKRDHQKRFKKHTRWKSKVFCDDVSELLEGFEFELENFERLRYLKKRAEIEKDRALCEQLIGQIPLVDKEGMQELLKQYADLPERKNLPWENVIFLHQSVAEYNAAQTKLREEMRKHTDRCLEKPDELELTSDLETDEARIKEYIKDLDTKFRRNIQFFLLGKSKAVENAAEETMAGKKAAEKKLVFFYRSREEIKEVDEETGRFLTALAERDTSIDIEKPDREYALRSIDNEYLSAAVSQYVRTVRRYIERRDQWIKEDRDRDFEKRLERSRAQIQIENLRSQLGEKEAEIRVLERRDTEAAKRFDLDDWMKNHVSTPGDDRLFKIGLIISGNCEVFQGKLMRIGDCLLSPEFEELIESYITNPKHNYISDKEFRKGLALGIVKAIESPGEIADGIAAGVYEAEKLYGLARTISCSD
ncbi:MAG: hypothetical protein KAT43_03965 [Nanoarchaeota archaeon]|nr:hypothetical protein [Nanoarchaeota archaeon]